MEFVFGMDETVEAFVAGELGERECANHPYTAIGLEDKGELIAGCVYKNYKGHDIEMVFAAKNPKWASRRNIATFFAYPFHQLGCVTVSALVGRHNKRSRKLMRGLGFVEEGKKRKGFDGVRDLMIYGMVQKECRFLKERNYG